VPSNLALVDSVVELAVFVRPFGFCGAGFNGHMFKAAPARIGRVAVCVLELVRRSADVHVNVVVPSAANAPCATKAQKKGRKAGVATRGSTVDQLDSLLGRI